MRKKVEIIYWRIRTILIITLILFVSNQLKATAVLVLIYPQRIILAVDSRLIYTNNFTGEKKYRTGCKMSTVNNFAFAFVGYRGFSGNVSAKYGNFNTDRYIRTVLQKPITSLNQTFSELVEGLEKELTNQMRTLRKLNFKDYSQYLKENKSNFINLVVIGDDKGTPFAFALNTTLKEVNGIVSVKAEASIFENETTILHAGVTDAVAKYIKAYPALLQKEQPLPLINKLMDLTLKDKPLEAGPPVDIIEVTKEGIKWIKKKEGCKN